MEAKLRVLSIFKQIKSKLVKFESFKSFKTLDFILRILLTSFNFIILSIYFMGCILTIDFRQSKMWTLPLCLPHITSKKLKYALITPTLNFLTELIPLILPLTMQIITETSCVLTQKKFPTLLLQMIQTVWKFQFLKFQNPKCLDLILWDFLTFKNCIQTLLIWKSDISSFIISKLCLKSKEFIHFRFLKSPQKIRL